MDPLLNEGAERVIRLALPDVGREEEDALRGAISRKQLAGGAAVKAFEQLIAEAHGNRFGVATASGTTALQLALHALRIGPGDEVILPTLTMVAVAAAVHWQGATPVFVDSRPDDGNLDADAAVAAITRRTKAIIVPHLYGQPIASADMNHLLADSEPPIIEDCAECHYAGFDDGRLVGSRGTAATFSFYGNKIVSTGEGGMVICNDEALSIRMRSLRAHAFTPGNHFHHEEPAFGIRMTEMSGAIGIAQHGKRSRLLGTRDAIGGWYREALADLVVFPARRMNAVYWVMPILLSDQQQRDDVRRALAAKGIEHRTYFEPLHRQPWLAPYCAGDFPVADDLAARGLYLPVHTGITQDDVDYITAVVRSAVVN